MPIAEVFAESEYLVSNKLEVQPAVILFSKDGTVQQ